MALYEITGYIQIPVSATVEAETPGQAFEIGKDLINDGIGIEGDQYLTDEYALWDIAKQQPVEVVFTHVGHGHE